MKAPKVQMPSTHTRYYFMHSTCIITKTNTCLMKVMHGYTYIIIIIAFKFVHSDI